MITEQSSSSILTMLLIQLIASCGMLAVIWFVQLITYPRFAEFGEAEFVVYHQHYSNRVTWIAAPLMLIELGTAFHIIVHFWKSHLFVLALAGFLVVITLWSLTAFVQVPQHTRLSHGYSIETIRELVRGNWARTILWSLKAVLTGVLIHRYVFSELLPK